MTQLARVVKTSSDRHYTAFKKIPQTAFSGKGREGTGTNGKAWDGSGGRVNGVTTEASLPKRHQSRCLKVLREVRLFVDPGADASYGETATVSRLFWCLKLSYAHPAHC